MDAAQFMQQAKEDPQLNLFLTEVAEEAGQQVQMEEPQSYTLGGAEILIAVAAYALFRFLKDYFDHRRGINEVDIALNQEKVVDALIEDGFKPKEAVVVTSALLDRIAKRGKDDPALKVALGLVESGK